jgi:hypothetical protein
MLLTVGAVTTRLARRPAEIPFALIPVAFGLQQLVEGALWLSISQDQPHLNASLTHVYQLFSHIFWPIYVPLAVFLLEPAGPRRRTLLAFLAAGTVVGTYYLYFLLSEPTMVRVVGGHIDYVSPHFFGMPAVALYILATCGGSLASSHPTVRWFGIVTTISLAAAAAFYLTWFISVWCFFAAVASIVVLAHFLRLVRATRSAGLVTEAR